LASTNTWLSWLRRMVKYHSKLEVNWGEQSELQPSK
jgi:hypothetical protein